MALTVAKKVRRAGSGTDERVKRVPKSSGSRVRAAVAALHCCASTETGERESERLDSPNHLGSYAKINSAFSATLKVWY